MSDHKTTLDGSEQQSWGAGEQSNPIPVGIQQQGTCAMSPSPAFVVERVSAGSEGLLP